MEVVRRSDDIHVVLSQGDTPNGILAKWRLSDYVTHFLWLDGTCDGNGRLEPLMSDYLGMDQSIGFHFVGYRALFPAAK